MSHLPIAEDRISGGNIFVPTDIPYITLLERPKDTDPGLTVAKKGPEKKPSKLTATASVIMFGTLVVQHEKLIRDWQNKGTQNSQPEY